MLISHTQETKQDVLAVSSLQAPAQPLSLLGREQELESVCHLLRSSEVRFLTLTGTGGVGKTRLALQAASQLEDAFTDGLCIVPLAPIRDSELVIPTIAQALGLSEGGDRPLLLRVKVHLQTKRFLLLLDNFEQVIAAGPLLTELLMDCPYLMPATCLPIQRPLRAIHQCSFFCTKLCWYDPISRRPTRICAQ
jgi:NB-ARC domain